MGMLNGIVKEHELDANEATRAWREGDIGSPVYYDRTISTRCGIGVG